MALDEELDRIFAVRDRNNMQSTIDALLPILEEHPADARVLYEVGGAYDTAGKEQAARSFYEQALQVVVSRTVTPVVNQLDVDTGNSRSGHDPQLD